MPGSWSLRGWGWGGGGGLGRGSGHGVGRGLGRGQRRPLPPGLLRDLGTAPVVPRDTPLADVEFVAMDLEATGLDPRRDDVLSIGLLPVRGGEILLAGARHVQVRPGRAVGQSATVHGLTDDALAGAQPIEEVLPIALAAFLPDAAPASRDSALATTDPAPASTDPALATPGPAPAPYRRVLLAHFAQVETSFLAASSRRLFGASVGLQVVDTLEIERRRILRAQPHELAPGQLRLDACRRRRGLPRYRAHSALTDALACAELFLAQCAELEERAQRPLTLADVAERRLAN